MFDKLVESSSTGADLKPRRRIFVASFFFVAVLFVTAVVASIYAADFDLGTETFDIAELLTPVTETEPQPEPERVQPQDTDRQVTSSDRTTRAMNIPRIDEHPIAPTEVSTARSPYLTRPPGHFQIDANLGDRNGPPPEFGPGNQPVGSPSAPSLPRATEEATPTEAPPAPPKVNKPKTVVSEGVVNGKATHLPKPLYSAAAIAMRAQGKVDVQVTIDETGKVISARAVSGNPLLRVEAEKAAWKARFSPTYLSKVPVKVTGVIVYNFTK